LAQDWTVQGSDTLTLAFRGIPVGFLELSATHILMNGLGGDFWGTADAGGRFVYKQLTGDGSIIARVDRLDSVDPWSKAGVMIRANLETISSWADIIWAGDYGVRFQARLSQSLAAVSDDNPINVTTPDQLAQRAPVWVKLERTGDDFKGYYSTDGKAWTALAWNPQTIPMNSAVYIGLAVTAHNTTGAVTQAEFSEIQTTGSVTGSWQSASIGVEQPAGNLPDTFYVSLEDSSGHKATAAQSDPYAVTTGAWTLWNIPLSTFSSAGVKIDSIKKMTLGVGDNTKPASGATGLLYIDDIRVVQPTAGQ